MLKKDSHYQKNATSLRVVVIMTGVDDIKRL